MKNEIILSQNQIENRIFTIRGQQVMIDFLLAALYDVETKRVNEQVKRNLNRFPARFMFQLSREEWVTLQSQIATTIMVDDLQLVNTILNITTRIELISKFD